jgi:4a-hydroxytetrahydrobiopterin dehydratase
LVSKLELPPLMALVPSWQLDPEGRTLTKKFRAKNFMSAIDFFNQVAEVAEAQSHHPDLSLTNYRFAD